jgi:hypothetical protein
MWRGRQVLLHMGSLGTGTHSVNFRLGRLRRSAAAKGVLCPQAKW